uniref:Uncharacterized protein n=1 Tax=Ornithorhynchus anatinus TaxID=9258 RepID=A0A6I8NDZ7_ORNAN
MGFYGGWLGRHGPEGWRRPTRRRGHRAYLNSAPHYDFPRYRQLVHEVTEAFASISQEVLEIQDQLRGSQGRPDLAQHLTLLQDKERERLELVSTCPAFCGPSHRPGIWLPHGPPVPPSQWPAIKLAPGPRPRPLSSEPEASRLAGGPRSSGPRKGYGAEACFQGGCPRRVGGGWVFQGQFRAQLLPSLPPDSSHAAGPAEGPGGAGGRGSPGGGARAQEQDN